MKRLKKTLAVILTLCMMMSCVSVTAFATGTDASENETCDRRDKSFRRSGCFK